MFFGMLKELSENEFPTYESVMKYYMLIMHQLKLKNHNKDPAVTEIAEMVAANIERIWLKSSIPLTSHKQDCYR